MCERITIPSFDFPGSICSHIAFLWLYTDPSREQTGHEDRDIFNLLTKCKGLYVKDRLNELENVLREFNSLYCKYALRKLKEQLYERDGHLLDEKDKL